MDAQERKLMQKAAANLSALLGEVKELRQKVAEYERTNLAEDIALMQAAEGVISYEDLLDERDRLSASGDDLSAVKMAMQRYGPGKTQIRTVATEAPASGHINKASAAEPIHIVKAQLELEEVFSRL